jgi:plastocyanin
MQRVIATTALALLLTACATTTSQQAAIPASTNSPAATPSSTTTASATPTATPAPAATRSATPVPATPKPMPKPTPVPMPMSASVRAVTGGSGYAFSPSSVTIGRGGRVAFSNPSSAPHTFTADGGAFDSGVVNSGGGFSFTFRAPGTYAYHCDIHSYMHGTITVR